MNSIIYMSYFSLCSGKYAIKKDDQMASNIKLTQPHDMGMEELKPCSNIPPAVKLTRSSHDEEQYQYGNSGN